MAKKNPEIPGLERVGKVFGLMKIVTGNVDVLNKGSLQEQIDKCLDSKGDSQNLTVTYNSGDSRIANAWTDVDVMTSKETHKSLFGKLSTMVKNVRYLYKLLGTTDISKFGGGTVTGAIKDLEESKPGDATQSAHGLMTAADKKKLDGIAASANNYTHPSSAAGAKSSGLYKITTDANGHVTAVAAVTKADITALGIPGSDTNTTYGDATQSAHGLMTAADKKKLDGIATSANNYTHPSSHAASMITQDATHRFVSDAEKTTWNGKLNKTDVTRSTAVTVEGQKALDAIENNAAIEGTLAYNLAQLNSNIEFFTGGTPSAEINTLQILKTKEFISSASGSKLYKTVFGGYIDMGAYAVAGEEKYLGYVNNPYPSNPGAVPIAIPCLIKTYSDNVAQSAVLYIKGDGGVYLSAPPMLKSTGFAVVVLPTCEQYCYYH